MALNVLCQSDWAAETPRVLPKNYRSVHLKGPQAYGTDLGTSPGDDYWSFSGSEVTASEVEACGALPAL